MVQAIDIKAQMRSDNKIAANWIIHYQERKRSFDERRQEIITGTRERDENVGDGRSSLPGRPVENMACKLEAHETSRNNRL